MYRSHLSLIYEKTKALNQVSTAFLFIKKRTHINADLGSVSSPMREFYIITLIRLHLNGPLQLKGRHVSPLCPLSHQRIAAVLFIAVGYERRESLPCV